MGDKEGFETKMETLLNEWTGKINLMDARTETIAPAKRGIYEGYVAAMKTRHAEAIKSLAELKEGRAPWPAGKASVELLWKQLTNAYEKALCQFEGVHN